MHEVCHAEHRHAPVGTSGRTCGAEPPGDDIDRAAENLEMMRHCQNIVSGQIKEIQKLIAIAI